MQGAYIAFALWFGVETWHGVGCEGVEPLERTGSVKLQNRRMSARLTGVTCNKPTYILLVPIFYKHHHCRCIEVRVGWKTFVDGSKHRADAVR